MWVLVSFNNSLMQLESGHNDSMFDLTSRRLLSDPLVAITKTSSRL